MALFPPDAFNPDGVPWWEVQFRPGGRQRFGVEKRLASWIQFNMTIGSKVTMRQLRAAISNDGAPNTDEHFNRRLRELRRADWNLVSNKEDSSLGSDEYRLTNFGIKIWIDGVAPKRNMISAKTRRQILERDNRTCQICGVVAAEEYPQEPGSSARMTIGHIRANALGGDIAESNLQAECSRCNEPLRDEMSSGTRLSDLWPRFRRLSKSDKETLLAWLLDESRPKTELITLHDLARTLDNAEYFELLRKLQKAT